MVLDTILTYDATGGGTQAVVPPTSLTIKGPSTQEAFIVGYFCDGISVNDITITCATNPDWEPAGFTLPATSDGTAIGAGDSWRPLPHKIGVRGGDVLVIVSTSGANPCYAGLYIEYPGDPAYAVRPAQEGKAHYVTKASVAGGTNCAAGTIVQGATNLTGFMQGRTYTPVMVKANAAFTTTAFLGIRKLGAPFLFIVPIPLTDVAADFKNLVLPKGIMTVTQGDQVEVFWSSATAEQPTADVVFAY